MSKEKFEALSIVKEFKVRNKNVGRELKTYVKKGELAWKILGKKNPEDWDKEDFLKLWKHPEFLNPVTERITFDNVKYLRKWMDHLGIEELTEDPDLGLWSYKPVGYYDQYLGK